MVSYAHHSVAVQQQSIVQGETQLNDNAVEAQQHYWSRRARQNPLCQAAPEKRTALSVAGHPITIARAALCMMPSAIDARIKATNNAKTRISIPLSQKRHMTLMMIFHHCCPRLRTVKSVDSQCTGEWSSCEAHDRHRGWSQCSPREHLKCLKDVQLQPAWKCLTGLDKQALSACGQFPAVCLYRNQQIQEEFSIVRDLQQALLGCSDIEDIVLVPWVNS